MTEATAAAAAGNRRKGNWLISAVLVTLMFVVAAACIVMLAVTLIQTRVAATALEGGGIGIRKLDYVGRKWAALQGRLDESSRKLAAAGGETAELVARAAITAGERQNKFREIEDLLVEFHRSLQPVDDPLHRRLVGKGHDVQVSTLIAEKAKLVEKDGKLGEAIDRIGQAFRLSQKARQDDIIASARKKANADKIATLQSEIAQARADLDQQFALIRADLAQDKDGRARVENAFYELNINNFDCGRSNERCGAISGVLNRGLYHLLTLPPDLLTLMLVILMGVLGSALQISHAYFMRAEVQTIGGYFQRVSVGAMTALVIFIVAKAGVPVLADPSRLGGDAPINPYFVSFLAIVSGLLSENAIANIQAQGARLLGGGGGGPDRWARTDLSGDLSGQNLSAAQLAEHLRIDPAVVMTKLKGQERIGPDEQRVIAMYLRRDPRQIYTDIPPPAAARAVAPAAPAPTTTPAPATTPAPVARTTPAPGPATTPAPASGG
jgi:hypothetical protein